MWDAVVAQSIAEADAAAGKPATAATGRGSTAKFITATDAAAPRRRDGRTAGNRTKAVAKAAASAPPLAPRPPRRATAGHRTKTEKAPATATPDDNCVGKFWASVGGWASHFQKAHSPKAPLSDGVRCNHCSADVIATSRATIHGSMRIHLPGCLPRKQKRALDTAATRDAAAGAAAYTHSTVYRHFRVVAYRQAMCLRCGAAVTGTAENLRRHQKGRPCVEHLDDDRQTSEQLAVTPTVSNLHAAFETVGVVQHFVPLVQPVQDAAADATADATADAAADAALLKQGHTHRCTLCRQTVHAAGWGRLALLRRHLADCAGLPAPARRVLDAAALADAADGCGDTVSTAAVRRCFKVLGLRRWCCALCDARVNGGFDDLKAHLAVGGGCGGMMMST